MWSKVLGKFAISCMDAYNVYTESLRAIPFDMLSDSATPYSKCAYRTLLVYVALNDTIYALILGAKWTARPMCAYF